MLCASYGCVIRPFDMWPSSSDAAFETPRAKGGFLVSASLLEGIVPSISIHSLQGGQVALLPPPVNTKRKSHLKLT
jgi:hypothetical protein